MPSINKNLAKYNTKDLPSADDMLFGIIISEWNEEITNKLYEGAYSTLLTNGAKEENIITRYVPGSFELPLAAQIFLKLPKLMQLFV